MQLNSNQIRNEHQNEITMIQQHCKKINQCNRFAVCLDFISGIFGLLTYVFIVDDNQYSQHGEVEWNLIVFFSFFQRIYLQGITFQDGRLGVNFGGYNAGVGFGAGGLSASAGTPNGQRAEAGLGGTINGIYLKKKKGSAEFSKF